MKFKEFLTEKDGKQQLNEWFAGKEELRFFEDLAKKQSRLYNDAADIGYVIQSPFEKDAAREKLMELMKLHGYKLDRWGEGGTTTTLFIPIEKDEPHWVAGIVLQVSFWRDKVPTGVYQKGTLALKQVKTTSPVEILSVGIEHKTIQKEQAVKQFGFKHPDLFEAYQNQALTDLSKPLAMFITSFVAGEINWDFENAKVRITRNVVSEKGLQIHVDVSIPQKIEISDLDVAWDRVRDIIQKTILDSVIYSKFTAGNQLKVNILKRGPRGALFGVEVHS